MMNYHQEPWSALCLEIDGKPVDAAGSQDDHNTNENIDPSEDAPPSFEYHVRVTLKGQIKYSTIYAVDKPWNFLNNRQFIGMKNLSFGTDWDKKPFTIKSKNFQLAISDEMGKCEARYCLFTYSQLSFHSMDELWNNRLAAYFLATYETDNPEALIKKYASFCKMFLSEGLNAFMGLAKEVEALKPFPSRLKIFLQEFDAEHLVNSLGKFLKAFRDKLFQLIEKRRNLQTDPKTKLFYPEEDYAKQMTYLLESYVQQLEESYKLLSTIKLESLGEQIFDHIPELQATKKVRENLEVVIRYVFGHVQSTEFWIMDVGQEFKSGIRDLIARREAQNKQYEEKGLVWRFHSSFVMMVSNILSDIISLGNPSYQAVRLNPRYSKVERSDECLYFVRRQGSVLSLCNEGVYWLPNHPQAAKCSSMDHPKFGMPICRIQKGLNSMGISIHETTKSLFFSALETRQDSPEKISTKRVIWRIKTADIHSPIPPVPLVLLEWPVQDDSKIMDASDRFIAYIQKQSVPFVDYKIVLHYINSEEDMGLNAFRTTLSQMEGTPDAEVAHPLLSNIGILYMNKDLMEFESKTATDEGLTKENLEELDMLPRPRREVEIFRDQLRIKRISPKLCLIGRYLIVHYEDCNIAKSAIVQKVFCVELKPRETSMEILCCHSSPIPA